MIRMNKYMIPAESNLYRNNVGCQNATPAGSYTHIVLSGCKHVIPLGLGIMKELGGVRYE
jgi:hypothetical protein